MQALFGGILAFQWQQAVMILIGLVLIWLAIAKKYEPTLLLPIGFGTILTNIPFSAAVGEHGPLQILFNAGIATELFPLLIFIGIGAMIDFTPLLKNPFMLLFGAAAQLGIFVTFSAATLLGFSLKQAGAIGIIGAADGPTSIYVANRFAQDLLPAISVAAYSYMALVPIIQPPVIKLLTSKEERKIRMDYQAGEVPKVVKIIFPIAITLIAGIFVPASAALIGFLMFGNLIRECGVLESLSKSAQNELANLVTIFLGISIASTMRGEAFLRPQTLLIFILGLVAFIFDTAGGVLFAKFINLFRKNKINPMIGACGISAFPMSARVIHQMGQKEDPFNFLLMPAVSVNVGGQIGSVIAGGLILALLGNA
ncbi:MAG TPA: sodium ion-translocating decarboxylase subunit beta [Candidatus Syntrophosphaera sp.]|jgi:oxaloacetate decarboxylase beta subunit|nr:sodium ion-translocating decarboxylase subunit beta [Candidatus Cloacimonadota bacterium]OQB91421.1 MAG: Glutaconyl-CoA decarboxylase subunit beta [Candidatus Cloacimonetes bacterium ADurb.Bin117]HNU54370.1 sodium ion-translocating decarboxylase subunit beta [Candidatus Syntrophosphaera sp.]MDI9523994.1 sodium ion-translocating decarboxylase subunit beta [Candidatus Cloacimonadota bacterium]NLH93413.1 sodium ion-translocating decarboxylase subunit beta [Candidatus Cloacimonadota bacterium]